ncbi:hypothetical protein [Yersinia frederiksenii]|uniref:hypothetical protein n=1 Tax=Yersinia frederiksenii TaxID=29484 RepID=UPI0005E2C4CD|nr:hypothetical protein [Yersinia frederiksenii]CNF27067.1 Uncharacterised protein [Yersinia frederiksenii]
MNNPIKYLLLSLTFSVIPWSANACELAGLSEDECITACLQPEVEDYNACMLGGTPNPHDQTTSPVTGQTEQPASS